MCDFEISSQLSFFIIIVVFVLIAVWDFRKYEKNVCVCVLLVFYRRQSVAIANRYILVLRKKGMFFVVVFMYMYQLYIFVSIVFQHCIGFFSKLQINSPNQFCVILFIRLVVVVVFGYQSSTNQTGKKPNI